MSVTFVSALTGVLHGKLSFPVPRTSSTLHALLGQGVYLFRFIFEGEEISENDILKGDVTIFFVKGLVVFNIYFYEEIYQRMWFLEKVFTDLLLHLEVEHPIDIIEKLGRSPKMTVASFWTKVFQPELHDRLQRRVIYAMLDELIEQHIMQVNSVRRRNILHEMASTLTVNVYLRSDEENHLRLNLKAPVSEVMAASHASEEELVSLIMRIPLV